MISRARRRSVGVMEYASAALVLSTALAATAQAATLEEVISRHLEWQRTVSNYFVEIHSLGLVQGVVGTAFVDNTTVPATAYFEGDLKFEEATRQLRIVGNQLATRAEIGERAAQWALPQAPFGNSYSLFSRDVTLADALRRIDTACSETEILENPVGGLVGLRMKFDPGFLGQVDQFLAGILLGDSVQRDFDTTIWFNGDGRIERTVVNEGKPDAMYVTFKYLDENLPAMRAQTFQQTIDLAEKEEVYPSFSEMLQAIILDDRKQQKQE